MATSARRLAANAPGAFFVDESCIDCGACQWMAPATFDGHAGRARVHAQPSDPRAVEQAAAALLACPTASIGIDGDGAPDRATLARIAATFPRPFTRDVLHCGFHAEATYGAASWLLRRRDGNVLVDVPRFAAPLFERIAALGGVRWLVLTHNDDVAGHDRVAARFGCERVLHRADLDEATRDVERVVDGEEPLELARDLVVLPTPGHSRGSICLWHRPEGGAPAETGGGHLFTGDHLAWDAALDHPYGFREFLWDSWERVISSTRRLAAMAARGEFRFEWLLPAHGAPGRAAPETMAAKLAAAIAWMEARR
jgi:glyoxylase-like metal-dependent hydrolase (beta-lactamase superfamily II)/ferredoxin